MKAHAPGSITGLFVPPEEPAGVSKGASFAIADGIVADVAAAADTRVIVDGEERDFEPVELVLADLGVTAAVSVTPEVPIGYGFGASGAATLATAIAANAAFELNLDREALVHAAHRAEVAAGTGLGDVFIQDTGGVIWSADGGRRRVTRTDRIEYSALGGLATGELLADDETLVRIREAGERAFEKLPDSPSLRQLIDIAWSFARGTGLVTERVENEVDRVERAGGRASMAMLGETVFAVGVNGVLANQTRISTAGATLL